MSTTAANHPPRPRGALRACLGVARAAASSVADLIVPAVCLACRSPVASHDALCSTCWRQVGFIRPPLCDRLGLPLPYGGDGPLLSAAAAADPPPYGRARAVAAFDGIMRELIHAFKYGDRHDARRLFGRWLAQAGAELLEGAEIIVPVPLATRRLWQRQFNQAAILGQELSRVAGVPVDALALRRVRATPSQVGLSRQQRRANLRGAFAVADRQRRKVAGRNLLLVDDVITTGSTVEACTRVLLSAGAQRVDVLALAMVTDPRQVTP